MRDLIYKGNGMPKLTRKGFLKVGLGGFAALVLSDVVGCSAGEGEPGVREEVVHKPQNIVIALIDTLRADHLGCYGYDRPTSPRINRLAESGALFLNVDAHSSWTLPSIASLLTSVYPSQHGARQSAQDSFMRLTTDRQLLSEALHNAGFRTAVFSNVGFLSTYSGFGRGWDLFDCRYQSGFNTGIRDARETTDEALRWIRLHGRERFFVLVHYFDPHLRYEAPDEYIKKLTDETRVGAVDKKWNNYIGVKLNKIELTKEEKSFLETLYDAEIKYTDYQVGRLIDGLQALGCEDETLLVLTADHGEEFWDHNRFEHGHSHYQELLQVPLVMKLPGLIKQGIRVESRVRQIDIAPTITELAGVKRPETFAGESLVDTLAGYPAPQACNVSYAEGTLNEPPICSYRMGHLKLILHLNSEKAEIYDLQTDPFERHDLAAEKPDLVAEMTGELMAIHNDNRVQSTSTADFMPDMLDHLRSLGYIG